MKKLAVIFYLGILSAGSVSAQEKDTTYWKSGGFLGLTFSQVSLSDSWAAGGNENISLNGAALLFADYKKARTTWENSLDMGFGQINQNGKGFEKSDDKLNAVTKFGYQIKNGNTQWYFSGLLDFRSQFAAGYEKLTDSNGKDSLVTISKFMAPGYLTLGLGIDYKPNPKLSFNYIPVTGKFTFVNDQRLADKGAFGVKPGEQFRAELGSFLRVKYKDEIIKNVNLDTRLELFSNYIKDFGTIDVNWQNAIVMKVNQVLSANLLTQMIYDKDIKTTKEDGTEGEAKVQWKSVFGVGLAYNFGAQRKK